MLCLINIPLQAFAIFVRDDVQKNQSKSNFASKARKLNFARRLHIASPKRKYKQAVVLDVPAIVFSFREKRHFRFNL